MTPKEFMNKYRNMQLRLVDGRGIRVDVHQYRNAKGMWGDTPVTGDHKCTEGFQQAKPAIERKIQYYGMRAGGSKYQLKTDKSEYVVIGSGAKGGIIDPFQGQNILYNSGELLQVFDGKGSPDQISRALTFAADLGVVSEMLKRSYPSTQADVQRFADKYIGMDCNGFVGNYLKASGIGDLGPSSDVYKFAPAARRKKRLEDVRAGDVLVWMKTESSASHVAIIDSVLIEHRDNGQLKALECIIVESCGSSRDTSSAQLKADTDGLGDTVYVITKVAEGLRPFNVKRGLGWQNNPHDYNSKSAGKVAIASTS